MYNKSIFKVLTLLSPSILLRALALDIFLPCLPNVAAYFNASFATAQWILSIYMIGAGLGQLIMGPLSDHYGRRSVLLGSTLLFAFSSFLCARSNSIEELIALRLLQGLGACGTTVVTIAIVRDIFDDHITPRVYSYLNSIVSLAPILAPILGGILLVWTDSWRTGFYFVGFFSLIALIINYYFIPETNPRLAAITPEIQPIKFLAGYKETLINKYFWIYATCAIVGLSSVFMFFSISSILLIDRMGIPADDFGYYFACNFIIYLLGNIFSPKLQHKYGVDTVIFIGSYLLVLGAVIMYLYDWRFGLSTFGFILPMFVSIFGVGLFFGPCMAGAVRQFKHIAGIASACYGALLYCVSALVVTLVMQFPIFNTKPLALAMLLLGLVNLIIIHRGLRDF